jgi:hypothetical protein
LKSGKVGGVAMDVHKGQKFGTNANRFDSFLEQFSKPLILLVGAAGLEPATR